LIENLDIDGIAMHLGLYKILAQGSLEDIWGLNMMGSIFRRTLNPW